MLVSHNENNLKVTESSAHSEKDSDSALSNWFGAIEFEPDKCGHALESTVGIKDIWENTGVSKKLIATISGGGAIEYRQHGRQEEVKDQLLSDLQVVMSHYGKDHIFDHISYCLQEILDNACKANEKRVYFLSKGLAIDDYSDYEQGMREFKTEVLSDRERFTTLSEEHGYWVNVRLALSDAKLLLDVSNNAPILEEELQRVHDRMDRARIYDSVVDIFEEISDSSESAGLGIVMLCMMLRKIGVSDKNFSITSEKGVTVARLAMPLASLSDDESEVVSDSLTHLLKNIPQFPEHLVELKRMIRNPRFHIDQVLQLIHQDPTLTAEVLRMANSAYYRRRNKIGQVKMAINIIGVRGLESIINSRGAYSALGKTFPSEYMEPLWRHSQHVAALASILCKRYRCSPAITENTYNSALLHDIGRIVLRSTYHEHYEALQEICHDKDVSVFAVEDLIQGVNHSILGSKLAEKWSLPDAVVATLRYYRLPLSSPNNLQQIAKIVYLSHTLVNILNGDHSDYQTQNLPKYFGLSTQDTLSSLLELVRLHEAESD